MLYFDVMYWPRVAIWPSYRDCRGATSARASGGPCSGVHSRGRQCALSKCSHCCSGVYLPEQALMTSCPTTPPNIAATGLMFPAAPSASVVSKFLASSASLPSRSGVRCMPSRTADSASSALPGQGRRACLASKDQSPRSSACRRSPDII